MKLEQSIGKPPRNVLTNAQECAKYRKKLSKVKYLESELKGKRDARMRIKEDK